MSTNRHVRETLHIPFYSKCRVRRSNAGRSKSKTKKIVVIKTRYKVSDDLAVI